MEVCVTVDVEHDCPPYWNTVRGMEEGMPLLAELFREKGIAATYFTTGDMARQFSGTIRSLVDAGHELGCHGNTHRRFDDMNESEARDEIVTASETLRQFADVVSFRAPNLAFPACYLPLLAEASYRLDSSQGKHKAEYWSRAARRARTEEGVKQRSRAREFAAPLQRFSHAGESQNGAGAPRPADLPTVVRVPASITSSWLRLPRPLRAILLGRLRSPVVLFVHPWEFVDLRRERLRWDCRVRTGPIALRCLAEAIDFYRARSARFVRMRDLLAAEKLH